MPRPRHWSGLTAAEFRSELRRLNLTQQWFAEQCGFALSAVSKWAQGQQPVPQHVAYIIQLLDRLAYRGEMHEVESEVEAFVRMITSHTLQPSSHHRDASRIKFAGETIPDSELVPVIQKPRPRERWIDPIFRVSWDDDTTGKRIERWYSHRPGASRRLAQLRKRGIEATLEHARERAA
jgi:transcriptional regulator with XRE-family HTH domain